MSRRGFTLIELMVSVAVGAALLAATASAMFYLRALIARNAAVLGLHREAAAVQRTLAASLQTAQSSTQWRLEADPGAGGWG
ncbi:MAG: prepilin-type N-terminal cleavage/methylation domain-containing protein, partial [Xanthomonadales bacterium]|nr:prepilin-type N-terminal cleavage/methylation domain-containing protein [Xanthomonadales bacterium]